MPNMIFKAVRTSSKMDVKNKKHVKQPFKDVDTMGKACLVLNRIYPVRRFSGSSLDCMPTACNPAGRQG